MDASQVAHCIARLLLRVVDAACLNTRACCLQVVSVRYAGKRIDLVGLEVPGRQSPVAQETFTTFTVDATSYCAST